MNGFQERNPNFYVFNAVLHMDEATPHLHIDYIPVGHYKRGQDTQNGIAQALKEMGYGEGKNAIARWRATEVDVLNQICIAHGIEPLAPEKSRGTLEIPEYKEQRHKADKLAEQNIRAEAELISRQQSVKGIELLQQRKEEELLATKSKLDSTISELTETQRKIADSEEKLSSVTAETEKADAELTQKIEQINKALQYLPDFKKSEKAEHEYLVAVSELHDMLKSGMSIIRNKDSIISRIDTLENLVRKALDKKDKADLTIYDLREQGNKFIIERDNAREELKRVKSEKSSLSSENQSLKSQIRKLNEIISMLEKIAPSILSQSKQLVQEEKEQRQKEQQRQTEYQHTKKRKSWELE
jgi:chromosome segregation ATPase